MSTVLSDHPIAQSHPASTAPDALAILAHELRNPIGAIRNACSVMESAGKVPGTMDHARRLIARQIGQLAVLVDDLMDLPTLSRGRLRLNREWIDVVSEFEAAVESCAWAMKAAGHALRVEAPTSPVYAYLDGSRLRQAITNLLDNACKYTRPFGRICASLRAADGFAVFTVEDNGVGIARDVLPHVFDLFERPAPRSFENSTRGLRIGLALVRDIARRHGGEVMAASAGAGSGSTFTMRLPLVGTTTHPESTETVLPTSISAVKRNALAPLSEPCPSVVRGGLAPWQLKRALDYIKEHLGDSISVSDIASVTRLSASHFHRSFKRSFGLSVHLYLMRRRIEMAQRMMISTSESLGDIATACGMSDQSHLTRWFKRVLGETPNAWRRARREAPCSTHDQHLP